MSSLVQDETSDRLKRQMEDEVEGEKIAPQMVESVKAMIVEFAQLISQQQAGLEKIVSEISKPKTVSAKSSTGTTMTATVQ